MGGYYTRRRPSLTFEKYLSLNQSLTVSPVSCTSCTSYVSCQSCHQLGLGLTTPYRDNMQEPNAAGFVELAQDAMSCQELADMLNGVPGVERVRTRFEKTNEGTDRFLASVKSSVYSTPFEFEATRFLHSPEAGSATSNFALCFKNVPKGQNLEAWRILRQASHNKAKPESQERMRVWHDEMRARYSEQESSWIVPALPASHDSSDQSMAQSSQESLKRSSSSKAGPERSDDEAQRDAKRPKQRDEKYDKLHGEVKRAKQTLSDYLARGSADRGYLAVKTEMQDADWDREPSPDFEEDAEASSGTPPVKATGASSATLQVKARPKPSTHHLSEPLLDDKEKPRTAYLSAPDLPVKTNKKRPQRDQRRRLQEKSGKPTLQSKAQREIPTLQRSQGTSKLGYRSFGRKSNLRTRK